MADWTFYSPSMRMASAGDLLRAIPSTRIWRLERSFVEDGQDTREMVRAAEQLLDLDVTLRLQNEPAAATRLRVREPSAADRQAFAALGRTEFPAAQLAVVAEVTLLDTARHGGHLDIGDDVLGGLEGVFRGGVAHSPSTGELTSAAEIARLMDEDHASCSHIDLSLRCDEPQLSYVVRQLRELPPPFGTLLVATDSAVVLRARFPTTLTREEIDAVCRTAMEMAQYARAGHVRLREQGVWRRAVDGIGAQIAPVPSGEGEGVFGRLARLLRSPR